MIIREYNDKDFTEWKRLRAKLWPETSGSEHEEEMKTISSGGCFEDELGWKVFVLSEGDALYGFVEISLHEGIDVFDDEPVGYLEGWYIDDNQRNKGYGRLLTEKAEEWSKSKGCMAMASDVEFDNEISLAAHKKLGYEVVDKDDECFILIKKFV